MNLKSVACLYLYITLSFHFPLQTLETTFNPFDFLESISHFVSTPSLSVTRSGPVIPTVAAFFTTSEISKALDKPFYKKTHTPQFRNIIQEPAFLNTTTLKEQKGSFQFNTFFNRDYSRNYTESQENENPKHITAYINLSNETILEVFENIKNDPIIATQISNFADFNIPDLFKIFEPMKLQEHKIGFIGHYHTTWNKFTIDVKLPFLWVERNFYFTKEEIERIYNNDLLKLLGAVDECAFAQKYLISDQLGFGTLKATFSTDLIKNDAGGVQAGFTFYFPTEVAIKKGLIGTYRELNAERPKLNLEQILHSTTGTTYALAGWQEKIAQYFTDAFVQFTTNLLHTPLGFDGHPGAAFHVSPTWHITHCLTWKSSYSIELLMAMRKPRLFITTTASESEVTNRFNTPGLNSSGKVQVIEQAIKDRLFPYLAEALVMPGAMFNSSSSFHYAKNSIIYTLGYNSFLQLKEQILSHSLDPLLTTTSWNVDAAEKPYSMQIKLFGKINKTILAKSRDWDISLYFDYAFANEALGNDFLINFKIQGTF